jgi:hypothetical protein
VYNGQTDITDNAVITISREQTSIYEESLQLIDGVLEIVFKKDAVIPDGVQSLSYLITAVVDGLEVTKKFKVHVFVGDVSYDLRTSTSVIKKNQYGTYAPSEVRVYIDKSELSNTKSSEKEINWIEEGLTVYYTVNDNPHSSKNLSDVQEAAGKYYACIPLASDTFGTSDFPSL